MTRTISVGSQDGSVGSLNSGNVKLPLTKNRFFNVEGRRNNSISGPLY